jgi:autotransporter-associated beta strand protein
MLSLALRSNARSRSALATTRLLFGLASVALVAVSGRASATSFTITGASTTAQTLAAGQSGTITSAGSLTVSGSTVAVTITGSNATLTNSGTLQQTGTGRAIRDNTGVSNLVVTNNANALMQTADADVIQMNKTPASVTLNNYGTMTSLNASKGGAQAVDFNAIQSGANVINNYAGGVMQARDADAVRPGVNGVVTNDGTMKATNTTDTGDDGIDAQTNSGVQITNANTNGAANANLVEGARHGITGGAASSSVSFTMDITNNSHGTIRGDDGSGVNIDGFNANELVTIHNAGTITGNGVTGDGDGVDVDGVVDLTNTGIIQSLNSAAAPSGSAPSQSEGITVGGGSIVNAGTIEGDVAAGNPNAIGRGITLAGVDTSGTPEPIYANSVITNQAGGLIRGQTDSAIAVDGGASGFAVTINNAAGATIEGGGTTAPAIRTGADNDTINDSGTIEADTSGKAIDMGGGNNHLAILGGAASVIGAIDGGVGGTNSMTIDPGAGNAFSHAASISHFAQVAVQSGTVTFTGNNTYTGTTKVAGGTLVAGAAGALGGTSAIEVASGAVLQLAGSGNRVNDAASLALSGGTFDAAGLSEEVGQLLLGAGSVLDLDGGSSIVRFANSASLSGSWSGTLSIYGWSGSPSGSGIDQVFFGADATGLTAAQLAMISFYSGNGSGFLGTAAILGDGEIVPSTAVPEPSTALLVTLFGAPLLWRRRRPDDASRMR